jgi:hypothetical protein
MWENIFFFNNTLSDLPPFFFTLRQDIAEILLRLALSIIQSIDRSIQQSINQLIN